MRFQFSELSDMPKWQRRRAFLSIWISAAWSQSSWNGRAAKIQSVSDWSPTVHSVTDPQKYPSCFPRSNPAQNAEVAHRYENSNG
jgi:hypothetical protein